MENKPSISIILDKRYRHASGLYPVKLQAVFAGRKQKRYSTSISATEREFNLATGRRCPKALTDLRDRIKKVEKKALGILDDHDFVGIDIFERLFLGAGGKSVGSLFDSYIKELDGYGQIGTRNNYKCALESIKLFAGRDPSFLDISQDWLKRYNKWMRERGRSVTTISMYLRCLRKIYNDAIDPYKLISMDHYPFGKKRFKIQSVKKPKTALTVDQKNKLLVYSGKWQKSVDFWVFSYFCNGMNLADIARLRNGDLEDEFISFERVKISTTAPEVNKIVIPVRPEVAKIIARRRSKSLAPSDYLFPVLEDKLSPAQQKERIKDFIKEVNGERIAKEKIVEGKEVEEVRLSGLKAVAAELGFRFNLTTYTARHTFSNVSLQMGATTEFIKEALGHQSIMTTEGYLSGFDRETKKKMSEKL